MIKTTPVVFNAPVKFESDVTNKGDVEVEGKLVAGNDAEVDGTLTLNTLGDLKTKDESFLAEQSEDNGTIVDEVGLKDVGVTISSTHSADNTALDKIDVKFESDNVNLLDKDGNSIIPEPDLSNYVTLNTEQTISGRKTMKSYYLCTAGNYNYIKAGLVAQASNYDCIIINGSTDTITYRHYTSSNNYIDFNLIISTFAEKPNDTSKKNLATLHLHYYAQGITYQLNYAFPLDEAANDFVFASRYWVNANYAKSSDIPSLDGYATEEWVNTTLGDYAKSSDIPSLDGYATEEWVNTTLGDYAKSSDIPSLDDYSTTADMNTAIADAIAEQATKDSETYASKTEFNTLDNNYTNFVNSAVATCIHNTVLTSNEYAGNLYFNVMGYNTKCTSIGAFLEMLAKKYGLPCTLPCSGSITYNNVRYLVLSITLDKDYADTGAITLVCVNLSTMAQETLTIEYSLLGSAIDDSFTKLIS